MAHKIFKVFGYLALLLHILKKIVSQSLKFDLKLHFFYFKSKKEGKDQESIQSSTTPDPGYQWESDNVTTRAKRSALSQQMTTRYQQTDVHESITKQDRNNINDP